MGGQGGRTNSGHDLGVVVGSGTWMDVWMNEQTACGFDMAGNSIVFDIAEEVLPTPRAGRESLLGLFLSILWDKIKHTSILPPPIIPSPPLPSPSRQEASDTHEPETLSRRASGVRACRGLASYDRVTLSARKRSTPLPLAGAGMGRCMGSVRMKHAHNNNIGSLPCQRKRANGKHGRGRGRIAANAHMCDPKHIR